MTFNIHTVYQVGGEVSGDIPLRPVGTAVYSRTVLLNHSCSGNTARYRMMIPIVRNLATLYNRYYTVLLGFYIYDNSSQRPYEG